jgi:hypothetical protein
MDARVAERRVEGQSILQQRFLTACKGSRGAAKDPKRWYRGFFSSAEREVEGWRFTLAGN